MKVAPPGGQFCNQCKCDPANDQFCKTMQVALSGGWFCNQCKCRHLVNKFSTDADALAVLAVPAVWASSPSSPALLTVLAVQAVLLSALLLCTYRIYRALWACSIIALKASFCTSFGKDIVIQTIVAPRSFFTLSHAMSPKGMVDNNSYDMLAKFPGKVLQRIGVRFL